MLADLKSLSTLLTRKERWRFAFLLILMVIAAVLEAIGIGSVPVFITFIQRPATLSEHELLSQWLPALPEVPSLPLLVYASALLLGFIIFKNIFALGSWYIQSRLVLRQHARLADRMFRTYQTAPYDWFLQRNTSELQRNILQDTRRILIGVVMPVLDLAMCVLMAMAITIVMFIATPGSTLLSIIMVGCGLFLVIRSLRRLMKRIGEIQHEEQRESIKAIQHGFGAFVDARILGREDYLAKIHHRSVKRFADATILKQTGDKASPLAIETIAVLGLLVILAVLVSSGESIENSFPALSVVAIALFRLKQIAAKVASSVNMINSSRPYIPGLVNDLRELGELEKERQQTVNPTPLVKQFEILEADNVSYSYPNTEKPAIYDISLNLKRGESIAFVGSTGCGKSSLVNCILGLLEPQKGSITVNGIDIRRDPAGWRKCLGYIPQTIFLIDDTLRANIAFGVPKDEYDEARMQASLESAALAPFIDSLPEGLDTVVGERGVRLSGGQRQRLGIARALYFNPEVLIMDEATSALDNKTETEVMRAIDNLKHNRTLIMIAHRLSTVEDCDRLYLLEHGRIVNSGTYSELIEVSSAFRELAVLETN